MRDLYTITSSGTIGCLGGIKAPITSPTPMKKNDVIGLINSGHCVYKHNPAKPSEKVLVTLDNINSIRFRVTQVKATEDRIIQKAIRDEQTKYIASVHTKSATETPVEVKDVVETNVEETKNVEDTKTKNYVDKNHGKYSDKKEKKQEKLNTPDSFQKS